MIDASSETEGTLVCALRLYSAAKASAEAGRHDVAVETLRHESVLIFVAFGLSLVSMIVCACAMAVIAFGPGAAAACAVFMTSLLAQAWRLCVLTSELKANHRFLQQSWHVKTKEGADFDLAKTVLT